MWDLCFWRLLPLTSYVFWVDCCEPPHIGRIGMDGRGQVVVIDKEIYNPTALTIDYTNKRIYWADDNHILLASMDGTQRRKGEPQMFGFEGFLGQKGRLFNEIEDIFLGCIEVSVS